MYIIEHFKFIKKYLLKIYSFKKKEKKVKPLNFTKRDLEFKINN